MAIYRKGADPVALRASARRLELCATTAGEVCDTAGRAGRCSRGADVIRDPRPVRRAGALAPALAVTALAVALAAGCQKEEPMTDPSSSPEPSASSCQKQPGDVSVLRGGTFPLDAAATLRAGLQYEVKADPRTWKVMFMGAGVSESHDLAAGDTVTVAGRTVTVRDACADKIVLTVGDGGSGTSA